MIREKILVVDDDSQLRKLLCDRLIASGYDVIEAKSGEEALQTFQSEKAGLILLDLQLPGMHGMEVLKAILEIEPEIPVIILTAFGNMKLAVDAMKNGAYDFLPKPCQPDHLILTIKKALERSSLNSENQMLRQELQGQFQLIYSKESRMNETMALAAKVAPSPATVLIQGESGTGKLLLAHALHSMSQRSQKSFVQVQCTTLSAELLESDLFGHEKGAYTGAHQAKKGRVEIAHHGTLFLDEIGDVSVEVQAKLLRFIEHGEFERIGGLNTMKVDARVIVATHRDMQKAVEQEKFRHDLFYRLNVVSITVPPLRDRVEDIPLLVDHYIAHFREQTGKRVDSISSEALERIKNYTWPGNIRELKNAIERAVVLADSDTLTVDLLPPQITATQSNAGPKPLSLEKAVQQFKKEHIEEVLAKTGGNQTKAAGLLDIQRTYLNRLIRELGISKP